MMRSVCLLALLLLPMPAVASATVSIQAPPSVGVGAPIEFTVTDSANPRDFATIVPKGAAAGRYEDYVYLDKPGTQSLAAPAQAGDFELRVLGTELPYPTLARAPLKVGAVNGSVSGPPQATAGTAVDVNWTGPANGIDYVSIVKQGAPESDAGEYAYVATGNPARIVAPLVPGDYEIRYQLGQSHRTLARAAQKIVPAAPRTVVHFVGFAIGDAKLAASFRQWAALGNGSCFDARDAVALDQTLTQAVQPGFEVVDAKGAVVARGRAGGEPVRVLPGSYGVRMAGAAGAPKAIVVKPKETVQL